MKSIKVEWCKNWIKHTFEKLPFENSGIECGHFWDLAEKSGLWIRGTYGTPLSDALGELLTVETRHNENGEFLYNFFRIRKAASAANTSGQ